MGEPLQPTCLAAVSNPEISLVRFAGDPLEQIDEQRCDQKSSEHQAHHRLAVVQEAERIHILRCWRVNVLAHVNTLGVNGS